MRKTTTREAAPGLEGVRSQIEHWRRTRSSSRSRMPDALWHAAVALCEGSSVHAVSQQLGLGYDRLRRKVVEAELVQVRAAAETEAPELVELRPAEPLGAGAPRNGEAQSVHELEMVRPDGAVLRLRTQDIVDLYELTDAFLGSDG